ncbi:hypothetical protein KI387_032289 [Taxus chinensis]|uniref:Uncharacterized protein n=1 Tax=Taxus chinensis TaxID=29808 RepID=A0AA38C1H8_TAXCH|nr:hypothetical protein KI387_032289 [Taxus chinensis]
MMADCEGGLLGNHFMDLDGLLDFSIHDHIFAEYILNTDFQTVDGEYESSHDIFAECNLNTTFETVDGEYESSHNYIPDDHLVGLHWLASCLDEEHLRLHDDLADLHWLASFLDEEALRLQDDPTLLCSSGHSGNIDEHKLKNWTASLALQKSFSFVQK